MTHLNQRSGRGASASGLTLARLIQMWALIALGVLFASFTSAGIEYADNRTLLIVILLISLFNVLLRPLLILFALPFVILTFGLGILVINALLVHLTAFLVEGFIVASFWSSLWVAVVISAVTFLANLLFGPRRMRVSVTRAQGTRGETRKRRDDDIIDV
ncbi:MAG: phage holin family protein [Opitutales bacterium]|nr:phage holin family protein [Opitutales bacterium]